MIDAPHAPAAPAAATLAERPLRVLFAVQGEGRGHMTQALAVAAWLRARGHEVVGAVVGESERRELPGFFRDGLGAPVLPVPSPNFIADERGRIRLWYSTAVQVRRWFSRYEPAVGRIHAHVRDLRPDVVVNFFEAMVAYWALRRRPAVPIVAVAHQYMCQHPAYRFAPGAPLQEASLRVFTWLQGLRARTRIALSLYPAPDVPSRRLRVAPPILRPEVHALAAGPPRGGDGLLAYLMEPELADGLRAWSARRPEVRVDCFYDGPAAAHGGLRFHPLDGSAFLERMAHARGVAMTAGFEGVAEAMLLGKPVLMVPVPGHYEQRCNALDAARAGAGVASATFDLDLLLERIEGYAPPAGFREWAAGAEAAVVDAIEAAAASARSARA